MFRHLKIPWDVPLEMNGRTVLKTFGITECVLVIYETDKRRCKITLKIFRSYKVKDKKSG